MKQHKIQSIGFGSGAAYLALHLLVSLAVPLSAAGQVDYGKSQPGEAPETTPEESQRAIKQLWKDMRNAFNRHNYSEVCGHFDALRRLGQDLSASSATVGYAYLRCAQQKANIGDIETSEKYLVLSIQYGGEKEEHTKVRAIYERDRGLRALEQGKLEAALRSLELAYKKGLMPEDSEFVSAMLAKYAYQMHGSGEDVRALAALDAALLFDGNNRQAELLRREIWAWDYGVWIVIALLVFLIAVYFVFRQWREVRIRDIMNRGY